MKSFESPGSLASFEATHKLLSGTELNDEYSKALAAYRSRLAAEMGVTITELHELSTLSVDSDKQNLSNLVDAE